LKAYQRNTITIEGEPIADETVECLVAWLQEQLDAHAKESATMVRVQRDAYLREQDLENLHHEDIVDGGQVALLLGRGARGESTKQGRDQGVLIDYPDVADALRALKKATPPGKKVFNTSMGQYRQWWNKGLAALGVKQQPPHSLRHAGASADLATGYRTFEQVQRRGRWKAEESVQRYAKVHAWFAAEEMQPAHIKEQGKALLKKRKHRNAVAKG